MAIGLTHRRDRDERPAGAHAVPDDSTAGTTTTEAPVTRTTAADRDPDTTTVINRDAATTPGATIPRRRLAPGQPVPPGGAVAPVETLPERDRVEAPERDRVEATEPAPVEPVRWARTSFTATLSLIIGVCATLAALSGRLAPLAVAIGVLGLVLAAVALAAVSRRHVTGHHVALLGLAFSIAGVVFGILAMNKSLPWLDGGADQAGRLRDWLDAHWSWLARW
jgi:hypothetical protein